MKILRAYIVLWISLLAQDTYGVCDSGVRECGCDVILRLKTATQEQIRNALLDAAECKKPALSGNFKILIKELYDKNFRTEFRNRTFLHKLISLGGMRDLYREQKPLNLEAIKTLLKYRVDLNLKDDEGNTALDAAIDLNHYELIRMLLQNGADMSLQELIKKHATTHKLLNLEILDIFLEFRDINQPEEDGDKTPLHVAANTTQERLIFKLILSGGDIYAQDQWKRTPINNNRSLQHQMLAAHQSERAQEARKVYLEKHPHYDENHPEYSALWKIKKKSSFMSRFSSWREQKLSSVDENQSIPQKVREKPKSLPSHNKQQVLSADSDQDTSSLSSDTSLSPRQGEGVRQLAF